MRLHGIKQYFHRGTGTGNAPQLRVRNTDFNIKAAGGIIGGIADKAQFAGKLAAIQQANISLLACLQRADMLLWDLRCQLKFVYLHQLQQFCAALYHIAYFNMAAVYHGVKRCFGAGLAKRQVGGLPFGFSLCQFTL